MNPAIAIIGMACTYPDARTPGELWENVLAQRRSFRRLPQERLRREDYYSSDPAAPDRTYAGEAAVIEGYEFDRIGFRVVGSTFRSADLAHWLALDVAARALADAGFVDGKGLPHEATGVLLGNTLTGEFSRANTLRLRWPYVRRLLDAALAKEDWPSAQRQGFLFELEAEYKSPFPPVGEETLAGGLSNTIAGRICNQFDLKGGGYTVDGACASSLLALANGCSALAAGDLDIALAGGVDLSLDPFEIVGFAKTGALATDEMRVFDRRSAGFWPGEGCGMVVLMRHEDALAEGRRVYAMIRGWGISSDGSGGITRPESSGQLEALRRAYRRAGFGIDTVGYCEGHGTGTALGDATELEVLTRARREAKPGAPVAVIGSIKANIGHTKAAAGIAGLIKATMAVHTQVLPPTTGCQQPHDQFGGPSPALRVLREAELWPHDRSLRASVSAMGFGGINAHVVLESGGAERRTTLSPRERSLSCSYQDAELFLLRAETAEDLMRQAEKLLAIAARLSRSELTDLSAQLQKTITSGTVRAAIVASKPEELDEELRRLGSWLQAGDAARLQISDNVFLASGDGVPRVAFLFPGQGSPTHLDGGIWRRRFESVRDLYAQAALPTDADAVSTRVMQPAIVTASLAALRVLQEFGLEPNSAIGHSLGELTALHWAGALDSETLLRIVRVRGAAMSELGTPTGAMLAVAAPWERVQDMLVGEPLAVVGYNSPRQTVVAGEAKAIGRLARRAAAEGCRSSLLPVSQAFHTPLVSAATPVLAEHLARETFHELKRPVISTVTGKPLDSTEDLRALLCRQVTSPVRFIAAFEEVNGTADLMIEVGPGSVLTTLARDMTETPVVALDAGGDSLRGLLQTLGAAFALGAPVRHRALFANRFTRPFSLDWKPKFFVNPCELAPISKDESVGVSAPAGRSPEDKRANGAPVHFRALTVPADGADSGPPLHSSGYGKLAAKVNGADASPLEVIRRVVAERAELPVAAVQNEHRMLSQLHLNSITVGQLVSQASKQLGLPPLVGLTDFANASVGEIARALEELQRTGATSRNDDKKQPPPGVGTWVRTFVRELVEVKSRPAVGDSAPSLARSPEAVDWKIFAPKDHPFSAALCEELKLSGVSGVVVCLPEHPNEEDIPRLLEAGKAALAMKRKPHFVVVQHGWGGGGFARTLHLESPDVTTCVVNVPTGHPRGIEWIVAETMGATGFTEAHFTTDGRRFEPRLKLVENSPSPQCCVGPKDVFLVTGGGKGIAAECALALARETGVGLALLGRSDPQTDKELADNLARIAAAGVRCCYVRADVTDTDAVRAAVAQATGQLGPITAVLHGAGVNTPQLISALDETAFRHTVAPKVQGAINVLAAVDATRLRLFATFGSIIARTGLPGEADYATANEWLAALTEDFQARHPQCRCLTLEWSVWSGAGMGERLGRVESLVQQGITPISVDEGVRVFCELLRQPSPAVSLVVTGRFGEAPTLKLGKTELPLHRFLERKRVHYPGVELIVDAELSASTDPYLDEHVVQRQRLFPAVLGLEAMAQAALALTGSADMPVFENVEFLRPVAVPDKAAMTIRIAALRRNANHVEVCLRSAETDFQIDHFRAVCQIGTGELIGMPRLALSPFESDDLPLDPATDLYGRLLFHRGRFRLLRRYRLLRAKECVAEIVPGDGAAWFGPYLPAHFVLGDPAVWDAAIHSIQASIPHRRILPTGIERMVLCRGQAGTRVVHAKERSRDGNNFIYDVEVTDTKGDLMMRLDGLRLRAVEMFSSRDAWPRPLLAPYLERRLEELYPGTSVSVALEFGAHEERPASSDAVLQQALGKAERIWRRPDGKPVFLGQKNISAAHAHDLTLAVASDAGAVCDLEIITARAETIWRDLLGKEGFKLAQRIAHERAEELDMGATRVWGARECLKKSGVPAGAPLVLDASTADGWVLLRTGSLAVATCVTTVRGTKGTLVASLALQPAAASAQPAALAEAAV